MIFVLIIIQTQKKEKIQDRLIIVYIVICLLIIPCPKSTFVKKLAIINIISNIKNK